MMFKTPAITTERLLLKPLGVRNARRYYEIVKSNKERLLESFPVTIKNSKSIETIGLFLQKLVAERRAQKSILFGIWLDKTLIGSVSIFNIDWKVPKAEFAYFIDRNHTCKGYATEAITALISFCFDELGFYKIIIRTIKSNTASQRIALKSGFKKEAVLKDDFRTGFGATADIIYFTITQRRKITQAQKI